MADPLAMHVQANVIEILEHGEIKRHGPHDFLTLPRIGDEVSLSQATQFQILEAVRIEHAPVAAEPFTRAGELARKMGPRATVYVKHVRYE